MPFLGPRVRAPRSRAVLDESPLFRPLPHTSPWGDKLQQKVSNRQSEGRAAPEVAAGPLAAITHAWTPALWWPCPSVEHTQDEPGAHRGSLGGEEEEGVEAGSAPQSQRDQRVKAASFNANIAPSRARPRAEPGGLLQEEWEGNVKEMEWIAGQRLLPRVPCQG